jgi:hypothetical protein
MTHQGGRRQALSSLVAVVVTTQAAAQTSGGPEHPLDGTGSAPSFSALTGSGTAWPMMASDFITKTPARVFPRFSSMSSQGIVAVGRFEAVTYTCTYHPADYRS